MATPAALDNLKRSYARKFGKRVGEVLSARGVLFHSGIDVDKQCFEIMAKQMVRSYQISPLYYNEAIEVAKRSQQ